MGVTGKPILGCNLACKGCYEGEIFAKGKPAAYDLAKFIQGVKNGPGGTFTMHGGEALLMPLNDLRTVFAAVKDMGRPIAIQTNLTIVTDATLDLFQEYGVQVGVSLNGPNDLNGARSDPHMTDRIHRNIEKALHRGLQVGIIVTLSKTNAEYDDRVNTLIKWAHHWGEKGVDSFRFNLMFNGGDEELWPDRARVVYEKLAEATFADPKHRWLPFREMADNLMGLGLSPCWFKPCDPYHTDAVHAVLGQGEAANCLRTAHDGTAYLRTEERSFPRQDILYQIHWGDGGCGDCRYWNVCHGGCPAEGEGNDWRNKTRFCGAILSTYNLIEGKLRGLMPNINLVTDWNVQNPGEAVRVVEERLVNPLGGPSTWTREGKRGVTI